MHRLVVASAMLATILGAGNARAASGDVHRCTVRDFLTSESDEKFVQRNKAKLFDIFELEESFSVSMRSKHFKDGVSEFNIVQRGLLETGAISADDGVGVYTLAIEVDDARSKDTSLNASIALQGADFVNVWFLSCIALS